MKRFVLLAVCVLTGMVCNAQLRPPVQTDTLVITGVKYNYAEIRKENWPCSVIYKSTTMFSIGDSKFKILDAKEGLLDDSIYFTLTDLPYTDNNEYTLIYNEDEYDHVIKIWFSDYEFTCKKLPPAFESVETGTDAFGEQLFADTSKEDYGQSSDSVDTIDSIEKEIPFQLVEEKPSFKGGNANAFSKWVNERLVYPEIAKKNGVSGRVTLQFTVETDGRVTNVKVLRGVDPSLDKEAVRVVSQSPKWEPGKQDGTPVNVIYTFPVIFQLR
ncbi:MAG: energy transducer TonB [Bacteroidetes bacterium]|uniref:Energy transducer TonB n=1 Tax=Candidatus Cryptobacteroides merdavium TaxID=2840769 RepID=A0A9D9EDH9_9BACT|nr:energy transducer TonB [Candidatus Cryptobacteroides merdavium]